MTNTRWWESYLVRYLIGTPIGVVCALALMNSIFRGHWLRERAIGILKDGATSFGLISNTALAIGLTLLGLLFCYLSSAPITIIHATRMFGNSWFQRVSRYVWIATWLFLVLVLASVFVFSTTPMSDARQATVRTILLIAMAVPAIWILLAQMLCIFRLHADQPLSDRATIIGRGYHGVVAIASGAKFDSEFPVQVNHFVSFYTELARQRASNTTSDLRETYTHMREHANSVFIVLLEISLSSLIILLLHGAPDLWPTRFAIGGVVVLIWILPNVFIWAQANRLERCLLSK